MEITGALSAIDMGAIAIASVGAASLVVSVAVKMWKRIRGAA